MTRLTMPLRLAGAILLCFHWAYAEPVKPAETKQPQEQVGDPIKIDVVPAKVALKGNRQFQHLIVTGYYADGNLRDLTRLATFTSLEPKVATVNGRGQVNTAGDGKARVSVRVASHEVFVDVAVADFAKPDPVNFRNEVVAALTRNRCNSGACHGTPSGKNGFRLSLQGYLPEEDYDVLTREAFGRRTDTLDPVQSLILKKGTGNIHHEGGKRLFVNEESYKVVHGWIAEGCKPTPANAPTIARLEILPGRRVLRNQSTNQQLAVLAHHSDGTIRDVTPVTYFTSSDEQTATVTPNGLVSFKKKGSVAILCRVRENIDNVRLSFIQENPKFAWNNPTEQNYIDKHVFAKLKELQILPSEPCSDDEFLRRVYLDVVGLLPTPQEVLAFLADKDPAKRTKLIDRVLDLPEYSDYWALKWADVLRNTRKQVTYRGAHNYRRYLVETFATNRPFNEFVFDILTSSGDTMINPAANYYRVARDPQDCTETTAQLFLGVRIQCAKCHNHPFERWTQNDYYGLAAFFARVKHKKADAKAEQEVVFLERSGEVTHLRTGQVMKPAAFGSPPFETGDDDRRLFLAKWLTSSENPFFAKSVVNRIWYHLIGKGVVDPVDDFRDSNPPCNEELLDALAKDFIQSGFNFKQMVRTILNSRTYQLSAKTNPFNADDERYFSRAYPRLLPAEPLLDAISTATEVPEKFADLPLGTRAIQLPDAEINHEFLQAFGQPTRELACECARESDSTLNQALNLINGGTIHGKLRDPKNRLGRLIEAKKVDKEIIEELYLATLSRPVSEPELQAATAHIQKNPDRRKALEDVHWALINCKEFLFRH